MPVSRAFNQNEVLSNTMTSISRPTEDSERIWSRKPQRNFEVRAQKLETRLDFCRLQVLYFHKKSTKTAEYALKNTSAISYWHEDANGVWLEDEKALKMHKKVLALSSLDELESALAIEKRRKRQHAFKKKGRLKCCSIQRAVRQRASNHAKRLDRRVA